MLNPQFKIRIRDRTQNLVGQLTSYINATFIPRWNGVGTFTIKASLDAPGAENLTPGYGVNVVLPDGYVFSGQITDYDDEWDSTVAGNGEVTVSGVEDKFLLAGRLVLPNPAATYTAQTSSSNYVRTGATETIIKDLVRQNIGPNAISDRRLPGLYVMPDLATGGTISISARYDNLLDLVQRIASPVGMGFNLVCNVAGEWAFSTTLPNNVSSKVRFSRSIGNLTKSKVARTAPSITRAIVAGQGVGTARNISTWNALTGAVDPIWGFLDEQFIDKRDSSVFGELQQAAVEALNGGKEQTGLQIEVIDTDQIKSGRDYGLGSIVKVTIRDVDYVDTITEIKYSSEAGALRVTPTIGAVEAVYGRAINTAKIVRSISARVALLERRL